MGDLVKLKMNLLSLIRLAKTELWDSIEDLKTAKENIESYKKRGTNKNEIVIRNFKNLSSILTEIIINNNKKLLNYYAELHKFDCVKAPSEMINTYNHSLNEINILQHNLEKSILLLEENIKKVKYYNNQINNSSIEIVSSQTNYYINKTIFDYNELNKAKLEYYKEKYPNILTKKYN